MIISTAIGGVYPRVEAEAAIDMLKEAVVVIGDVGVLGQGVALVRRPSQGADLDTAEHADAVGVFLLDKGHVVKVATKGALVVVRRRPILGQKEHVDARVADTVVVVGDAEQLNAARDRRLHHVLGPVLAAERIVGMRMKILDHIFTSRIL